MRKKRYRVRTGVVAGSVVVCLLTPAPAVAQIPQGYIVIDLGPLAPWSASDGRALNDANQVVGYSANSASFEVLEPGEMGRAVLWWDINGNDQIDPPDEIIDLGTLRRDNLGSSWAFELNNATGIVGRALSDTTCPPPQEDDMLRGFISSGIPPAHVLVPLPGIENGDRPPTGHGVNNATPAQIAGERKTRCVGPAPVDVDDYKPLIWADGPSVAPIELPQPPWLSCRA